MINTGETPAYLLAEAVPLTIDVESRILSSDKNVVLGVKGDKDVNHIVFQIPRYYDGLDFGEFKIEVNYTNAFGDPNLYVVNDVYANGDDLIFSWLVGSDACSYAGKVRFYLRLTKLTGATVEREFRSCIFTGQVKESFEVVDYQNPIEVEDIVARLYKLMQGQGGGEVTKSSRRYVDEYGDNIDDAFTAMIADCTANGYIACAKGYLTINRPIVIGNCNVDFSEAEIYINVPGADAIQLTGAEAKKFDFGIVTSRQGIAINVNTATAKFQYNVITAKKLMAYSHCLNVHTTNFLSFACSFYCDWMRCSNIAINLVCDAAKTKYVADWDFHVSAIESYREIKPNAQFFAKNGTHFTVYNMSIETPVNVACIVLENAQDCAFYNLRNAEYKNNPVQYKLIGESYNNRFDGSRILVDGIDTSEQVGDSIYYNEFSGLVLPNGTAGIANCEGLRVYSDCVAPVSPVAYTHTVTEDYEYGITYTYAPEQKTLYWYPNVLLWEGGNITIDDRTLNRMPKLTIIRTGDTVGSIKDHTGSVVISGSDMAKGVPHSIRTDNLVWSLNDHYGEYSRAYRIIAGAMIVVAPIGGGGVTPADLAEIREQTGIEIRPRISFVDDDGGAEIFSVLYPWMQQKNVPYTFAISVGDVGGSSKFATWQQLQQMAQSNLVDFSCHAVGDDVMSDYTAEEMAAKYDRWHNDMAAHGLRSDASTVIYNHGSYVQDTIDAVVSRYFKFGFTVTKGINTTPFDSFHMKRVGLFPTDGSFTLAQAKAYVDQLAESGDGWLVFFTHCYYESFDLDGLTELVEYIRSKGIMIDGVEAVAALYAVKDEPDEPGEWKELEAAETVYNTVIGKASGSAPGLKTSSSSATNCVSSYNVTPGSKLQISGTAYSQASGSFGKYSFLRANGSLIRCDWWSEPKSGVNARFAVEDTAPAGAATLLVSGNSGQLMPKAEVWSSGGITEERVTEMINAAIGSLDPLLEQISALQIDTLGGL